MDPLSTPPLPSPKHSEFQFMIHHLISVPLTSDSIQEEVLTIKRLAQVKKLQIDFDSLLREKLTSRTLDWTTLLLLAIPNQINGRVYHFCVNYPSSVFYPTSTSKNMFSQLKYPIPRHEKSGVYSFECEPCPVIYIGQTGRPLYERIPNHIKAVEKFTPEK